MVRVRLWYVLCLSTSIRAVSIPQIHVLIHSLLPTTDKVFAAGREELGEEAAAQADKNLAAQAEGAPQETIPCTLPPSPPQSPSSSTIREMKRFDLSKIDESTGADPLVEQANALAIATGIPPPAKVQKVEA